MRDKTIQFRVNEFEYKTILELAKKENRTVSELIREVMRLTANKYKLKN